MDKTKIETRLADISLLENAEEKIVLEGYALLFNQETLIGDETRGYIESIDFVTYLNNQIVPIEVKAGTNTKSRSLSNIIEKEKLAYGIKLSMNNVNCSNPKFKCFPLYMSMFIKNK